MITLCQPDLRDDSVVVFLRDADKVVIYLCTLANIWKAHTVAKDGASYNFVTNF